MAVLSYEKITCTFFFGFVCIAAKSAADFATTQRKYAFDIVFLIEAGYQETK